MKILFSHRYYHPDTPPYAHMLRVIAGHFAAAGHDVRVFAGRPSYRGLANVARIEDTRVTVKRCWVFRENRSNILTRVLNVLLYSTRLCFNILRHRPDVVTASTFPPVIAGWTASLAARLIGAKFVYHMMDIHPEVSKYSGGRLGRGLPFRILRWLDNQTLRRAAAIVVLSEDMADTLRRRNLGNLPIHIINNFMPEDNSPDIPAPDNLLKATGVFRVIFAGNLGNFQNLPLLADGVARCFATHPKLELLFLGDGAALPKLAEKWEKHPQVRFAPFLPFAQARCLIAGADVGLVSLSKDIYRVSYPSKMMVYLGLGTPVLALIEPNSALAAEIGTHALGAVPAKATPEAIEHALLQLLDGPDLSAPLQSWHKTHASQKVAMARWQKLISQL